jgi:hypothetical protein
MVSLARPNRVHTIVVELTDVAGDAATFTLTGNLAQWTRRA